MPVGRILTLTMVLSLFSGLAFSQTSEFSMVSDLTVISPGELVSVDIYVDDTDDLGAWQVTIEVTGGDFGSLDLEDLYIDTSRTDYVFYGLSSIEVTFLAGGQMAAAMLTTPCPDITGPGYLGTAEYRASSTARGEFNIRFVDNAAVTLLRDCGASPISLTLDQSTIITVECAIDAHCDDGEACTDDTCNSGICVFIDVHCDDGEACTDDTCNNGTCVFTNDDTNTCTDGNDCTDDSCSSGTCVSTNDDTNTCTDGNPCTTADTCSSGTCSGTNESSGTPCDDGLFCTETDECDGSGTCVGSGDPCPARRPNCCELLDVCSQWFCV